MNETPNDMPSNIPPRPKQMVRASKPNLCGATKPTSNNENWHDCMRRKDHVLKAGKYARQHMDSKCTPPVYWDPTPEEIVAAREQVA